MTALQKLQARRSGRWVPGTLWRLEGSGPMTATNVLPFPPRKPAARSLPYKCIQCSDIVVMLERLPHTVYCGECPFGAEMRPVEK